MNKALRTVGTALAMMIAPAAASAVVVVDTELDDAGSTFATAMEAGGIEVTGISGYLGEGGNDLFRFEFWVPVVFQVSDMLPDIGGDESFDVFDIGFGPESAPVQYCFDCYFDFSGLGGVGIGPVTVGPGVYYLGLADIDEYDASPITNYSMTITITPAAVPLPGALALLGGGLAAMGVVARRRRKA